MDLKIAFRSLRRNPAFAVLAIAILALGIGANTAIFGVVHAVLLTPLPYRDATRIVYIGSTFKHHGGFGNISGPDFLDYQKSGSDFETLAAYEPLIESVVANSAAEFTGMAFVSADFFRTLGIEPVQGRTFSASEWKPAPPHLALVSEGFWVRHFGAGPFAAGRSLKIGSDWYPIIGILPGNFHFPDDIGTDVWVPIPEVFSQQDRGAHNYRVLGRLKRGVPLEQAQAQMAGIADRLAKAYPNSNALMGVRVTRLVNFTVRDVKTALYVLLGSVVLVLLIACANVANLLLARGATRTRELAIRAAIGAGRTRIVRQLLVESLLISGIGCAAGLVLATIALPALLALTPKYVPRLDHVHIDLSVLLFCAGAGILATLLFGLAPALQASRLDPNHGLSAGGARGIVGGVTGALRQIFVTAQIALCLVLLVSAGLLLKSFAAITKVDLGFRPERLLVASVSVPLTDREANDRFFKPLLGRLENVPDVESASLSHAMPGEDDSNGAYIVTGQTFKDFTISAPQAGFSVVSPGYFRQLRIPFLAGRDFTERDDLNAPPIAIVSEALAHRSFPHENAVGQKILCGLDLYSMKWMTIVGVTRSVRMDGPAEPPTAEIYMPYLQHPRGDAVVIVKTRANPLSFAPSFRNVVRRVNSEAGLKLTSMEDHLATIVSTPRFVGVLVSIFAGLAMLLAMIGIYGVMAYSVSRRTAEIGLRFALGADRVGVIRMVLLQALKLIALGIVIGAAGAIAATRLLKSQLFGISPSDPRTYALMILLLIAVGILASFLPAWHASRTEPLEALRQE